ncbi:hypothetical protein L6R50_00555 [Myxococcota bacterium]|nr:hypothetical protein [Myxococcota bacterium]
MRGLLVAAGALGLAVLVPPHARGAPPRAEWGPRDEGPLEMPLAGGYDRRVIALFDLDPAPGRAEDWTGWWGTEEVRGQGRDGSTATEFEVEPDHEVLAPTAGVVSAVRDHVAADDPIGNSVEVTLVEESPDGGPPVTWVTRCSPLKEGGSEVVSVGDEVEARSLVGYGGGEDASGSGHLRLEVFRDGVPVDPWLGTWWRDPFVGLNGLWLSGDPAPLFAAPEDDAEGVGELQDAYEYLATGESDGWFRLWRADSWGDLVESRNERGGNGDPAAYSEPSGSWATWAGGSGAPGAVGVGFRGTDGHGSAVFAPRIPEDGEYRVSVTWGAGASARDVPMTVHHADGSSPATVTMVGGGSGAPDDPRIVLASPYSDDGDLDSLAAYGVWEREDCAPGVDFDGPEALNRLETATAGSIEAVLSGVEPGADLLLLLLSGQDLEECLQADGESVAVADAAPGTWWLAVESPGDAAGDRHPGAFHLEVAYTGAPSGESAGPERNGDRWHDLGTFRFEAGADVSRASVEVTAEPGLASAGGPLRVAADAVRFEKVEPRLQSWGRMADGLTSFRVLKGRGIVGIQGVEYAPAHEDDDAESRVAMRIPEGQRFFSDLQWGGWYRLRVPGHEAGLWVREGFLAVHNAPAEGSPDEEPGGDLPPAEVPDVPEGCACDSSGRVAAPPLGLAALLAVRRRRG